MTNYKRFISYLYYYENGQKRGNVGSARVEASDEICKLTIHCALKSVPKKICKVYLLRRKTSHILSEEVGVVEVKNGLLDAKLSFNRGIIVPNEFEFKDCFGIILMYSKDNYIGAKWDESVITYHEASLIEQAASTEKKRTDNFEPSQIPVDKTKKLEEHPQEETKKIDESPREELFKEEEEKLEYLPQEENSTLGKTATPNCEIEKPTASIREIMNQKATVQIIPEDEIKIIDINLRHEKSKENMIQKEEQEAREPKSERKTNEQKFATLEASKDVVPEDMSGDENRKTEDDEVMNEDEIVSATGGSAAAALNLGQWVDHPAARAILNRFVRMYPFDDGEIAECVRLEPKDIGLLPMTSWPLGNNSFVLHSYCNFRHLLFAKRLTRQGCEYYLMIPGTLNARERQLAKMFGFENFKCSRRRSMRDGEFGYWYVEIIFN